MTWFLIAVSILMSGESEIRYNTHMVFPDEMSCVGFVDVYGTSMREGFIRQYPNEKLVKMQCVDEKTLEKIQEDRTKRGL